MNFAPGVDRVLFKKAFGGGEAGTLGRGDAGEIKSVATGSDVNAMGFIFGWSDG
jgi:hypothetical protein